VFERVWLTWKQHRFETGLVVVFGVVTAVAALFEAWRLNSVGFPASCLVDGRVPYWYDPSAPTTVCQAAGQRFHDIYNEFDFGLVAQAGQLLPFLAGLALGAQLVAGEIDGGTAPFAWMLADSRWKWLSWKLVAAVLLLVPFMLIAGMAEDVLQGAINPGLSAYASYGNYTARGVYWVLWAVAALFGTAALGTIIGRASPTVMVALVICIFARGTFEPALNATILRSMAVLELPGIYTPGELVVGDGGLYLDGQPWSGDLQAWYQDNEVCTEPSPGYTECRSPDQTPEQSSYAIPGDQYWQVVARGAAAMLAGTALFAALGFFLVGRRRPY
jgi:hypothetical protein